MFSFFVKPLGFEKPPLTFPKLYFTPPLPKCLVAQVAQVAELHIAIWVTSKIYLNNFETISGYDV